MSMLNHLKTIIVLLLLLVLSGCGAVVRHLDSSWIDDKMVYDKSQALPPLEIPPELNAKQSISHPQAQSSFSSTNEEISSKDEKRFVHPLENKINLGMRTQSGVKHK